MKSLFIVGLGSALGGISRYGCTLLFARWLGEKFPWGTLFVNVSGSFVIGLFFALTAPGGRLAVSPDWRIFVTVGLCGGYTTFSSFSLQTMALLREGNLPGAGLNIFVSFALSLLAAWAGFACADIHSR